MMIHGSREEAERMKENSKKHAYIMGSNSAPLAPVSRWRHEFQKEGGR